MSDAYTDLPALIRAQHAAALISAEMNILLKGEAVDDVSDVEMAEKMREAGITARGRVLSLAMGEVVSPANLAERVERVMDSIGSDLRSDFRDEAVSDMNAIFASHIALEAKFRAALRIVDRVQGSLAAVATGGYSDREALEEISEAVNGG